MSQESNQDSRKKTGQGNEAEEKTVRKAEGEVRERQKKPAQRRPVQEEVGGVEQFAEQFKEDRMFAGYIIGGVIILLAIIIIAVYAASSGDGAAKKTPETKVEEQTDQQDEVAVSEDTPETVDEAVQEEPEEPEFVDDGSLQEDAYEDVNNLVKEYFDAMANGDGDKIMQLKSDTSEEELLKLETKSAYIEGYENIKVYTKLGPVDSSYVAFVSYDINFKDVNTLAPGLTTMYICPRDDGSLGIYDGALDENVAQCIKDAATDAEAVDLINRTQVAYNDAIEADADLKKFMDELPTRLGTEVAAAMAAKENESTENTESTEAAPADTQESAPADTSNAATETVMTTEAVNVRASDSENADKIGRLDAGVKVTRYESKENGWSRVDYNGQEGYVKSEFLKVVSGDAQPAADNAESAQPAQTDNSAASADNGGGSQGTVTIKESVNVRASGGEGAEKIGNAFAGETYKLIMKQEDGWSKIQFGDKVGFVKSEYVTFN